MRCIVTAGPTYESLDEVRRLTNFSTGRLGAQLARFLGERGEFVVEVHLTRRPAPRDGFPASYLESLQVAAVEAALPGSPAVQCSNAVR